jgi:hypothetical protein
MNHPTLKAITMALLIIGVSAGARAQTAAPKARDEVRRELIEAMRDGTLPHGEASAPQRELRPQATAQLPRSRADVLAELDAARRDGELLAGGESSLKLNELHPSQYPVHAVFAGKTRTQVKTELAEAQRNGEMVANGESGLTLRELHPEAYPRAAASAFAGASAPARMR